MIRPSLVIPRLRDACPFFEGRVAGAAALRRALQQDDFPVPHAFVVPLSDNGDGQIMLSSLDQELAARFGVVVCVSNTTDEAGAAGVESLFDIRQQLFDALIGWSPSDEFAPVIYAGMPDDPDTTRSRAFAQFDWYSTTFAGRPAV